jgi:hypothetical protein
MGVYDSFSSEFTEAQLKCFSCNLNDYKIGDKIPVAEYGFPSTATFCDWGGTSIKYKAKRMGETEPMGTFVIIREGVLEDVTEDETKVVLPVYSKYGAKLDG